MIVYLLAHYCTLTRQTPPQTLKMKDTDGQPPHNCVLTDAHESVLDVPEPAIRPGTV